MTPENNNVAPAISNSKHSMFQVTKLSKSLAALLFICLPFVGGYIGYSKAQQNTSPLVSRGEDNHPQPNVQFGKNARIFNTKGHSLYVVNETGVTCLTDFEDKLQTNHISNLDPLSFKFFSEFYGKDKNGVYKLYCSEVQLQSVVSDVETFKPVEGYADDWDVFYDKNFVYVSLPQEFLLKKVEEVDRATFEFIGRGRHTVVEIMEGLTQPTQNSYFKDKNSVYVIEFGQFKKLEVVPETFTIAAYEQSIATLGE